MSEVTRTRRQYTCPQLRNVPVDMEDSCLSPAPGGNEEIGYELWTMYV